jgi:Mg-chelatase subunit ChlD
MSDRVDDERAVSEVVGYVLLVGMVSAGLVVVTLAGSAAIDTIQGQSEDETARLSLDGVDARLSSLSSETVWSTQIGFRGGSGASVTLADNSSAGQIRVAVNGGVCEARVPLSTLRYERDDESLAYQAGGIFRANAEGSAVVSPPDVTFEDGTLDLTVVNLTGTVEGDRATIRKRANFSANQSLVVERSLFEGDPSCKRPKQVSLTVTSEFYRAWGSYFEAQSDGDVTVYDANTSARVVLDRDELPESVNDAKNNVVDLQNSSVATVDYGEGTITVDKSAGNTYTATGRPLGQGVQVSNLSTFEGDIAYRPPLDVVFTFDESGSMSTNNKTGKAQLAAKRFVGKLNDSYDRVGLTGFTTEGDTYRTDDGEYLTDDFDEFNDTIGDEIDADGGTNTSAGLEQAVVLQNLKSNSSREKVVILLADGEDNDEVKDKWHRIKADVAAGSDIEVHTIGYNDDEDEYDEELLKNISSKTGGTFHKAGDEQELNDVFDDIFATVTETKVIANTPVTLNASLGTGAAGRVYQPTVGDDPDEVAMADGSPNVNDPTAPPFSLSLNPGDGSLTNLTAYRYGCAEYEVTNVVKSNATADFTELRCVDINESTKSKLPTEDKTIYLDGNASAESLVDDPPAWWEGDIANDTFYADTPDPLIVRSNPSDDYEFELASNQAVVVFDFGGTNLGRQRLIMLYEIGLSTDSSASELIDVTVVTAEAASG